MRKTGTLAIVVVLSGWGLASLSACGVGVAPLKWSAAREDRSVSDRGLLADPGLASSPTERGLTAQKVSPADALAPSAERDLGLTLERRVPVDRSASRPDRDHWMGQHVIDPASPPSPGPVESRR
jgi:hypothetical protein